MEDNKREIPNSSQSTSANSSFNSVESANSTLRARFSKADLQNLLPALKFLPKLPKNKLDYTKLRPLDGVSLKYSEEGKTMVRVNGKRTGTIYKGEECFDHTPRMTAGVDVASPRDDGERYVLLAVDADGRSGPVLHWMVDCTAKNEVVDTTCAETSKEIFPWVKSKCAAGESHRLIFMLFKVNSGNTSKLNIPLSKLKFLGSSKERERFPLQKFMDLNDVTLVQLTFFYVSAELPKYNIEQKEADLQKTFIPTDTHESAQVFV